MNLWSLFRKPKEKVFFRTSEGERGRMRWFGRYENGDYAGTGNPFGWDTDADAMADARRFKNAQAHYIEEEESNEG